MQRTRRDILTVGTAIAGGGVLSGCLGGTASEGEESTTTVQSSFFVFGDIAAQVAGEEAAAELLVPVGQHGHGWEPGPQVRSDIRSADLVCHGMDGFQPWVDDVRTDLSADDAGVATVDVSADVDLLEAGGGHEEESRDGHEEESHDGEEHEHNGADDGDGGHGTVDPHFWMDPLRVRTAVGTVERALAEVDGGNADGYAENAAAFRDRLDALDERIESVIAAGSRDVVLVAGHGAFRYLSDRYDVDVHALTGVSPDDRPTARDIERAQEIIDEHGLDYVCADPLEPQQAPSQLVAETDAQAVLPLTAIPGLREGWEEDGWGYVDIMREVNVPTLERALE